MLTTETTILPSTILECSDLSMQYGQTEVLRNVSLKFEKAKIHVLVGQNGAGKTTLARILAGLVKAKTGQLVIKGKNISLGDVQQVRALGLDMVHQRFSLPPDFMVSEALEFAAAQKKLGNLYSGKKLSTAWQAELDAAGIPIPVSARIRDLPVEVIQSLEILRVLSGNVDILILDEPTALLSPTAAGQLFERMRGLREQGVTQLVILHKLREVLDIADTISVIHNGNLVLATQARAEVSETDLSSLIITGKKPTSKDDLRDLTDLTKQVKQESVKVTQTLRLKIQNMNVKALDLEPALENISFDVKAGEIVGVAGIEGNGQRSIVNAISGLSPVSQGSITLFEQEIQALSSFERRKQGLRVVPFDRMTEGSSLTQSLWENVTTWQAESFKRTGLKWLPWLSVSKMRAEAKAALDRFGVKYSNLNQEAASLSGGNLQRLILARELSEGTKFAIVAQPSRGLDFQATAFVWDVLHSLKNADCGILLISSDLDELFAVSDRVLVVRAGKIVGEFSSPYDYQQVGDAMIGATKHAPTSDTTIANTEVGVGL